MDKISLDRLQMLDPAVRESAIAAYMECWEAGLHTRITRSYSSIEQQNEIYAQGRTKPGKIVTWAKGGDSIHNYRLAVDFVLLHPDKGTVSWSMSEDIDNDHVPDWMEVVAIWKKHGWQWGGDWPKPKTDPPHLQKTLGLSLADLKAGKKPQV